MIAADEPETLENRVFHCSTLDAVPFEAVRDSLGRWSFACLRGLIDPADVRRAKDAWRARFDRANDRLPDPTRPELVRRNSQWWINRDGTGRAGERPQSVRTFFNPLWDADVYGMHGMFRTIVRVRNRLMDLPDTFAENGPERGAWTASRIHHYPKGVGHMAAHMDKTFSALANEFGVGAYFQVTLLMSRKGVDYVDGGAYFVSEGRKVFFEAEYEVGDLVIYDERIVHGVDLIDPDAPVDLSSPAGRLAAFANLYRMM